MPLGIISVVPERTHEKVEKHSFESKASEDIPATPPNSPPDEPIYDDEFQDTSLEDDEFHDISLEDLQDISLEDLLEIERTNPTPDDILPSIESIFCPPVPESPILGPGAIPAFDRPIPDRPAKPTKASRSRRKTEPSPYEREVMQHRRRMRRMEEENMMTSAGFRLQEALMTDSEKWLYHIKPLRNWRVSDPSPLRRCWIQRSQDEFEDIFGDVWEV